MTSRTHRYAFALMLLAPIGVVRAEDAAIEQLINRLRPISASEATLHGMRQTHSQ
jgi:hypothetical protein